jgi:NADPH2:quinone reductase
VVTSTGPEATGVSVGDAVAYTGVLGAYAQYALVPVWRLVKLPPGLDQKMAAAVLLQGMTAHFLSHDTFPLKRGLKILVHAGAGGVGLLLIQMASKLGAHVITTTSTEEKASLAREAGAEEVIIYTEQDFEEEVRRLTDGEGVSVVYDSVGRTTFDKSLKCLARRGCMVAFGQSSGLPRPITTTELSHGSKFLTRPLLPDYTCTREELVHRANEVFSMVVSGNLKVRISKTLPLSQAAEAHRLLEGRQTTGKLLLLP